MTRIDDYLARERDVTALGQRHFARVMPGIGLVLWWHDCQAVAHISWGWVGNNGSRASGHRITSWSPLNVEGSLVCGDCMDHGHIRAGKWVPV